MHRRGAFSPGVPVLPICLQYATACPPRVNSDGKRSFSYFNAAWTIGNTFFHFFRMILQFQNSLTVKILDVYQPSEQEKVLTCILKTPLFVVRIIEI